MKQYIKKALWIIPFVFSLNLSATDYYWVGNSGDLITDGRCWSTSASGSKATTGCIFTTGTAANPRWNLNTSSPSSTNSVQYINTLFSLTATVSGVTSSAHTWDFNNFSGTINCVGAKFNQYTTFKNATGGSNTVTLSNTPYNISTTGSGTNKTRLYQLEFNDLPNFSSTRHQFSFTSTGNIVRFTGSTISSIYPVQYRSLEINSTAPGNWDIASSTSVTVDSLLWIPSREFTVKGTLVFGSSGSPVLGTGGTIVFASGCTVTDNRSTANKSYGSCPAIVQNSNTPAGTYTNLTIGANSQLAGNTTITGTLQVGTTVGDYCLDINGKILTLSGSAKFDFKSSGATTSSINPSSTSSTLAIETTYAFGIDESKFLKSITFSDTAVISNLILNSTSNPYFYNSDPWFVINNCTLKKGSIELSDMNLVVNGTLNIDGDVTDISLIDPFSTLPTYININGASSALTLTGGAGGDVNLDPTQFKDGTINKLVLAFNSGGNALLVDDITINDELDLLDENGSTLSLNGNTLTCKGRISTSIDGGKIIGSTTSNLICSTTVAPTIYFDQTNTNDYTLSSLTLANGSSCSLGSNLTLTNTLDLGTGTLTTGSNTLTFAGSSATWINRTTGKINPVNGTIKYAQTSTAGTDHSIELAAYSSDLNNLTIDFANACTFTPTSDMTITGTLNLSGSNNTFVLNGTTLTVSGSVSSTGGKFKGSSTSNLYCSGTSSLYFDQTDATTKTLKNLKIQGNNASVTLANALNITAGTNYGSVEVIAASSTLNTGNNLTLKSDANGTARIANSPGTISGRYYAEHYIAGGQREFRFLCAPVKGATALQWRNNGSTSGSSTNYVGIHISGTNGATDSFDATTANKPSAFYYDESTAGDVTNVNSTGTDDPGWKSITKGGHYQLTNGVGYRVLVRGDRNTDLTKSNPTASATTITSYGSYPRTSGTSVTINVNNSNRAKTNNGLNFIGNPYPSAIDWNSIYNNSGLSNVDNGYATYDPRNQKYVAWNGSLGDATRYISAGQAFFVMCTNSGSGSVTIDESDKYAGGPGGSFFLEKLTNHMRINLWYDSIYNSDAFLHFRNDAKNVKDVWDIQQFYTNGTNIASLDSNGKSYKINSMGELDSFESIPLSVAKTPEAQLKLSFYDVVSFEGYKIELIDTYLKTKMPVTEGSNYTFDITTDSNSVKDGRFYLNFTRVAAASNKILQASKIATIHPNPVTDNLNISLIKEGQPTQFEIFNVTGQLITKGTTDTKSTSVNTKDYASGTYYIVLKTNNSSQTIQFVK